MFEKLTLQGSTSPLNLASLAISKNTQNLKLIVDVEQWWQ
jgi:hypothetical protein